MLPEMSARIGRLDLYCVVAHGDTETTACLSFHANSDGADVLLEGSREASPDQVACSFFRHIDVAAFPFLFQSARGGTTAASSWCFFTNRA